MAAVVELTRGEERPGHGRYALVVVSSQPPKEGAAIEVCDDGQTFFADDTERDVEVILGRAQVWADENGIASIYVKRD